MKKLALLVCMAILPALAAASPMPADCPRIVSQSPYLTQALLWLDRAACIVGVSRYDKLQRPKTGGVTDPDVAAIEDLRPDFLLTSTWTAADMLELARPANAQAFRLGGFGSLNEMLGMLEHLARISRAPDGASRVEQLGHALRGRLLTTPGEQRKVLLLSACSGSPYSFGPQHYIGDVFKHAGFQIVEDAPKIRHLRPGEPITDITTLVEQKHPDLIVNFARADATACNAEIGLQTIPVIHLEGSNFFHPGPALLDGLGDLNTQLRTLAHE